VQCQAMIPGTSRSGATIIGGMLLGLSRKAATDFSFYLAIPTLIGAGAYSLYKERALLSMADLPMFGVGLVVSFVSAWLCIRWLLRYIASHSFVGFAYYRIVFGLIVLATAWSGAVTWSAYKPAFSRLTPQRCLWRFNQTLVKAKGRRAIQLLQQRAVQIHIVTALRQHKCRCHGQRGAAHVAHHQA